jgi:hypothetical protein
MKLTSKSKMKIGMSLMFIPFISFLLSIFSLIFTTEETSQNISLQFIGYSMVGMVFGSTIGFFISNPVAKREEKIKHLRQKLYVNICIDAILANNFEKAEFVFNKCLKIDGDRGFIRGLYLGMQLKERKPLITKERTKEIILSYKYDIQ